MERYHNTASKTMESHKASADYGGDGLVSGEMDEMKMASQFLEITDDLELNRFLSQFSGHFGNESNNTWRNQTIKVLHPFLLAAAKRLLPKISCHCAKGKLFSDRHSELHNAGRIFGLELEGLSPEDQEFEVARRFVRFASESHGLADLLSRTLPAQNAAMKAFLTSARKHAPGLIRPRAKLGAHPMKLEESGRWVRRGKTIILLNE